MCSILTESGLCGCWCGVHPCLSDFAELQHYNTSVHIISWEKKDLFLCRPLVWGQQHFHSMMGFMMCGNSNTIVYFNHNTHRNTTHTLYSFCSDQRFHNKPLTFPKNAVFFCILCERFYKISAFGNIYSYSDVTVRKLAGHKCVKSARCLFWAIHESLSKSVAWVKYQTDKIRLEQFMFTKFENRRGL